MPLFIGMQLFVLGAIVIVVSPSAPLTTEQSLFHCALFNKIFLIVHQSATVSLFLNFWTRLYQIQMISARAMFTVFWFIPFAISASVDCPNLIQLAYGFNMHIKQPPIWTTLQTDCCTASGVTCDVSQRVTHISWRSLRLNGTINGTAIPSTLTNFELGNNKLTNAIPNMLSPDLVYLDLSSNRLNESIPAVLPSNITILDLADNQLSSDIPAILPSGLTDLYLDQNQLTGIIPINLPMNLQRVRLWSNRLTGGIPLVLPNNLISFWIDGNFLSGDLPLFPASLSFIGLGYPDETQNQFSGILRLNRPIELYINDNWITDVVIQDSSALAYCDLSNTPLLGNPNIANLTMCTKIGLYNASLLPNTRMSTTSTISVELQSTIIRAHIETTPSVSTSVSLSFLTNDTRTSHVTHTFESTEMSVGTVQFELKLVKLTINLFMLLRVVVSGVILAYVLHKMPFLREMRKKLGNRGKDTMVNYI